MDVFDLVAKITLDSTEYDQSLGDAGESLKSFGDEIGEIGSTATVDFMTLATAAGKVSDGIWGFTQNAGDYGDEIDKMSQKMNMSAAAYQEWDYILQRNGTSIDSLKTSIKTLSTQAENGSDAFEQLGISAEELQELDGEELFARTIEALQKIPDETTRTYLAAKLLGRGATELGPLLNKTAEDTEALRQKAHELGGVMSDEAVAAAADFADSQTDLQTSLQGLKNTLAEQILPVASSAMEAMSGFISDINSFAEDHPKLTEAFGVVAVSVGTLGSALAAVAAAKKGMEFLQIGEILQSVGTWATQASTAVSGLATALSGGSLIAGLGLIAGIAAPVAAGIYEIGRTVKEVSEIGYLGDGQEWVDYADNVAYWEQEVEKAQAQIDALADSGASLDSAYQWLDEAKAGLKHATEEMEASAEAGGQELDRWKRYTEEMRPVAEETIELQNERAEAAQAAAESEQAALQAMAEAYQETYDSAYSSISGQLGLFNEFSAELGEDVDTGAEMIARWGEQASALAEYTENLQKASEYGLTDGLIQALSDGSAESAAALAAMIADIEALGDSTEDAGTGADAMVQQFNDAFSAVETAKEEFADTAAMLAAGQAQGEAYAEGLTSTEATNTAAGETIADAAGSPIEGMSSEAYVWGSDMGSNFANGLNSQTEAVSEAAASLAAAAAAPLAHSTPKEGPLMHDDEWGFHMMDNFIAGIQGSEDRLRSALHNTLDFGPVNVTGEVSASGGGVLQTVAVLLQTYLPQLLNRPIRLDDGTIIGRYAPQMDVELGATRDMVARGLAS